MTAIHGTIQHGDTYDIDEWEQWLSGQGVDITDVQRIAFNGAKMTIHRYAKNATGQRYTRRNGAIAMRRPLRRTILTKPPAADNVADNVLP